MVVAAAAAAAAATAVSGVREGGIVVLTVGWG